MLVGASDACAVADDEEWSYRGKMMLAPMVRVNSLAFRTLCQENGAAMVYSEEIVDRCMYESKRVWNAALGTVDFQSKTENGGGRAIFRTRPGERVVLQLGTACAAQALLAAQHAAADVRAIDINMGCPVKFSVQGGMGSALLAQPEKIRDILTTLRRNLPASMPVTCKIRLLDVTQETLDLAKLIESCGVSALAIHARRRHDRPRHWAQWDEFKLVRSRSRPRTRPPSHMAALAHGRPCTRPPCAQEADKQPSRTPAAAQVRDALPSSLPVILNGDVFSPEDVPRALAATGADSLMLARGALWNPSLFRASALIGAPSKGIVRKYEGDATVEAADDTPPPPTPPLAAAPPPLPALPLLTQAQCVQRYFDLGAATECPVGNLKYVGMLMLEGAGKLAPFTMVQRAKTVEELQAAAAACAQHPHFTQPGGAFVPAVLEPPPDLPAAVELPVNAWRRKPSWWKPGCEPPKLQKGKGRHKAAKERAAPEAPEVAAAAALVRHGGGAPAAATAPSAPSVPSASSAASVNVAAAASEEEEQRRAQQARVDHQAAHAILLEEHRAHKGEPEPPPDAKRSRVDGEES